MTYSEKLKDPRWLDFRARFIKSRSTYDYPATCEECGEDGGSVFHVHHKLYIDGREPWEYSFDDCRLLCPECHERIHRAEQRFRAFILTLPPNQTYELTDLLDELLEAQRAGRTKVALARAKNAVRNLNYEKPGTFTMREMAERYAKEILKAKDEE